MIQSFLLNQFVVSRIAGKRGEEQWTVSSMSAAADECGAKAFP